MHFLLFDIFPFYQRSKLFAQNDKNIYGKKWTFAILPACVIVSLSDVHYGLLICALSDQMCGEIAQHVASKQETRPSLASADKTMLQQKHCLRWGACVMWHVMWHESRTGPRKWNYYVATLQGAKFSWWLCCEIKLFNYFHCNKNSFSSVYF